MAATYWQLAAIVNPNHRGGDMPVLARQAYAAGFRSVVVSVQHGVAEADAAGVAVPIDYTKMLKQAGHKVGLMGWITQNNPVEQAELAVALIERHGATAYWADVEQPLKYSQPQGFCGPCFAASETFARRFRELTQTPLCVTTYAHPADHDIKWNAWFNIADARIAPQAYSNMFGYNARAVATFPTSINVGQEWNLMVHLPTGRVYPGFPKSYWHPMLGNWGAGGEVINPIFLDGVEAGAKQNFVELLGAKSNWNFWGFSVFDLEHQNEQSLQWYKKAIVEFDCAKLA